MLPADQAVKTLASMPVRSNGAVKHRQNTFTLRFEPPSTNHTTRLHVRPQASALCETVKAGMYLFVHSAPVSRRHLPLEARPGSRTLKCP
jgi:hypothetical protein